MLKEWRNHFENHIVERGYDIYYNGLVKLEKQIDNQFMFIVKEQYHISITLNNQQVKRAKCDCPQGKKHHLCKHLAACLIYLENIDMPNVTPNIDELIAKMSDTTKNQLLRQVLANNIELLRDIWQEYPSSESYQGYILNQIFLDYGCGKDDDISFEKRLLEFLDSLNPKVNPSMTFFHIRHLLMRLEALKNDESYTNYVGIEQRALELLAELLDDKVVSDDIFEFMATHLMQDSYLDFLFDYFRYDPYTQKKLKLINQCIKKIQNFEAWAKDYYMEYYQLKKLMVLYDMQDQKALETVSRQYWHYPKIREFWIEEALAKKDYPKAINLLEQSLDIDQASKNLQLKYHRILVSIFEITNDKRLKPLLRYLLFKEEPGDFEDYLRYKQLCTNAQWIQERKILLQQPMPKEKLMDILLAEGLFENLMQEIVKENDIYYLERHIRVLENSCPSLLYDVYATLIDDMAKKAHTRNEYLDIVGLLSTISNQAHANKLALQLIAQYPRKRALIELLQPFIN